MKLTRRKFLESSTLGLAAASVPGLLDQPMAGADGKSRVQTSVNSIEMAPARPGEIGVWVTNEKSHFSRIGSVRWEPVSDPVAQDAIVLDPTKKFQEILGFGGAFTDAACFVFNQLSPAQREPLFHELFHPSEMGLDVCRTCIGSSDYSTKAYSYDEGEPDPELKRFSIDHDREYILPMLREARKSNPGLFLFSSPWSPPGWMKSGGSILGGAMRRHYMGAYAEYFVKFLSAYFEAGVPVQAVTVQNEVDTDQDGRMPACIWPQEYEADFVGKFLGPAFAQKGLATKIWILDHNYNLWGRAVAELDQPDVRKYCDAIAWHGYVGKPEMISMAHQAHPEAKMHWTEGGPDYTAPDYFTDWATWGETFIAVLRNWCGSITAWNLALDEKGSPNIGPFPCGGVVTIDSKTGEITRSGQYWGLAHFSRKIRRGARRFDSIGSLAEVSHAAFENLDGSRILVIANPGPARELMIRHSTMKATVALDSRSLATLEWS